MESKVAAGMVVESPPIAFFYLHLHNSLRKELEEVWKVALALETTPQAELRSLLLQVEERCVFLQQVYKYHSVAEDEVVYPALDSKVKNVTLQYVVEHADEEHLFVHLLQMIREALSSLEPYKANVVRDLVCKVEEVRFTLKKHLAKEEKQLFPLLQQHFSFTEQAALIAQFLCCIPLDAVAGVLTWLKPLIPQEELDQLVHYIRLAVPDNMLLSLLVAWLDPAHHSQAIQKIAPMSDACTLVSPPLNLIIHVHKSIASTLSCLVEDAKSLLLENPDGPRLESLLGKHRFLRAVCRFHMMSEEAVMFPEFARQKSHGSCLFASCQLQHSEEAVWFEDLGRLLTDVRSCVRRGSKEVSNLLNQVIACAESVSKNLCEHMEMEEREIFPVIQNSLSSTEQCIVVWRSLRMMPLRLLERVMPWLACTLSESEVTELLLCLEIGAADGECAGVELLSRWVLQGSCSYPTTFVTNGDACPYLNRASDAKMSDDTHSKGEHLSTRKRRKLSDDNSIFYRSDDDSNQSNSGPRTQGPSPSLPVPCVGPSPIDHIFQFHRALIRYFKMFEGDARALVQLVDSEPVNWESTVQNMRARFQFLRSIYMAHSATEDSVVFPALESKEELHNISHSYMLDHKQEQELFEDLQAAIVQMQAARNQETMKPLAIKFSRKCAAVRAALETHVRAEETELWPLFAEHFLVEEQHKLVGAIVGRTGAEVMQTMVSWISECITLEEEDFMMKTMRTASQNTRFDKWLDAIRSPANAIEDDSAGNAEMPGQQEDPQSPLAEVAEYLRSRGLRMESTPEQPGTVAESSDFRPGWAEIFRMNQKQLEAAVRCVSSDDSLEPDRKAYIIQWIMVSKYIVAQQRHTSQQAEAIEDVQPCKDLSVGSLQGANTYHRTYHSETDGVLGCRHYQRKCALVAPCCSQVFTCRLCHDDACDHKIDRYKISEMVCMLCGKQQPVGPNCIECRECLSSYYCSICRLFDDNPANEIYHCQFCNVCRKGKGLGIDFFHCMKCNSCMHIGLFNRHQCRENCIDCNCPMCHENLFDSSQPVKELPCGHFLHSHCFSTYSQWNYKCPVCSKSMGDMSAYFEMLDSLLQSQPMPAAVEGLKQNIMCNDCCQRSEAPYHYVYHPCQHCRSYNTRVL